MRAELIGVVGRRSAHFASNLGVVELCLALHLTFDFTRDRLIWDTGHQIYPHKLITGRASQLHTIRTKGGLMGYPNPAESPFDLFMTGHAGCGPSTALGLKVGDDLVGEADRRAVAVIGDGALPSGIVFEAFNHASGLKKKLLVILNDNKMSICPRVGGLADYLDRARMSSTYNDWNKRVKWFLPNIPLVGEHAERWLQQFKDAIKASLHHGMLFEELGFVYLGPIDGHDLKTLADLPRSSQGPGRPGALARFDQQGARLRAGGQRPGQVSCAGSLSERGHRSRPAQDLVEPHLHRCRQLGLVRGMPPRSEGRGDHRGHVRGEQAAENSRRLSRSSSSMWASAKATPSRSPPASPRAAPGRSSTSTARFFSGLTTRSSRKSRSRTCRWSSALTARAWSAPMDQPTMARTIWRICASFPTWW